MFSLCTRTFPMTSSPPFLFFRLCILGLLEHIAAVPPIVASYLHVNFGKCFYFFVCLHRHLVKIKKLISVQSEGVGKLKVISYLLLPAAAAATDADQNPRTELIQVLRTLGERSLGGV